MKVLTVTCDHGQLFDNKSRWCLTCEKTVEATSTRKSRFMCAECGSVWPENVELVLGSLKDGDSTFLDLVANGDIKWH